MNGCIITFRSVTPAQRAERLLNRAGISCRIQRAPRWMEEQGCGYSLQMPCSQIVAAVELLRRERVAYRKIYGPEQKGKREELEV